MNWKIDTGRDMELENAAANQKTMERVADKE